MPHILYIARYRNALMERKIALMASPADLDIWLVRPSRWQDEYGQVELPTTSTGDYHTLAVPLLGKPTDHHRVLYGTLTFGMRAAQPHIIHAEEEPDSLAALQVALARRIFAPNARLILHTWQNLDRPKRWYVWWIIRMTLSQADAVLCANREGVTVLKHMGYDGPTAVILQEGVDLQVFRPTQPRPPAATFTVAYTGRLAPEKGVDTLLEAVRLVGPSVRLLLIGDGPARLTLEATARTAEICCQVIFVGPVPRDRLVSLLAQADVLVLPSRTTAVWKEQFGRVLVEAMACKVSVVGSDSGAIPEVIGNAGLIFPEGNAAALADCLRRLMQSPELRRELAERGYSRVRRLYSQEHIAEQTVNFYRQLMRC